MNKPRCIATGHNIGTDRTYYDLGDGRYLCEMHVVQHILTAERNRRALARAPEQGEDAADARRYRFLRNSDWGMFMDGFINGTLNIYGGTGEELDAAIDDALKREAGND